MKILLSIFFILFVNLSFLKADENSDLKNDLEEIQLIKRRSKLVACLSLLRNSLTEGNVEIKNILDSTHYDRSKSFDKILANILSNCEQKIKDNEMEKILTPENILINVSADEKLANLLKFDKNILKAGVELTDEEQDVLKEIGESSQIIDTDMAIQDEEIGLMGLKLSKLGNSGYLFIVFAIVLVIVIIFGGLYQLKCKKKTDMKDKKKKDKKN